VNRRTYLKRVTAAGAAATLAGCSETGGETSSDGATPTEASVRWTEERTGEDSFAVRVRVRFEDTERLRFEISPNWTELATLSRSEGTTQTAQLAGFGTDIGIVGGGETIRAVETGSETVVARYRVGSQSGDSDQTPTQTSPFTESA
jgi:hypothetical protein